MLDARELRPVYARAEPDDEYDYPRPDPLDPNLIDEDESDINQEEDEDEYDD